MESAEVKSNLLQRDTAQVHFTEGHDFMLYTTMEMSIL